MDTFLPGTDDCGSRPVSRDTDTRVRTVLVVDDEASIRGVCEDVLTARGYRVLPAADGVEAVRKFEEHRDEVDLVVMDIVMPRLNGRSAARLIRAMAPKVKVLFISGCSDKSQVSALHKDGFHHFLAKPFSVFEMRATVDKMLAGDS